MRRLAVERKRMIMTKKLAALALTTFLCVGLFGGASVAYAWDSSTEGNSGSDNSQSIEGSASGDVAVEGWIGTFDGTEDPGRPDPPNEAWINVKIPTTALFGSLASDKGAVYSPQYHVYNYSARGVEVTPTKFEVSNEPAALSGMELGLHFTSPSVVDVSLRNASNQFLGTDIPASTSIELSGGTPDVPTTGVFSMSGHLPQGFAYPTDAPYQPTYKLVLGFKSLT